MPFQGDAGTAEDYAMDMFGQLRNDHNENIDNGPQALSELSDNEDDNEEIAHMVAELEQSWEPHQEGAPHLEVEDGNHDDGSQARNIKVWLNSDKEENDLDGEGDKQHNISQFIIGEGYGVKPVVRVWYTDKYPNSWAGQPLSHEESGNSRYASALGGGDNLWASFNLKKDCEMGQALRDGVNGIFKAPGH